MKTLLILFINFYRCFLKPYFKTILWGGCRFTPTCSEYTCCALEKYGFVKGFALSIKRIFRCNPFSNVVFDPLK